VFKYGTKPSVKRTRKIAVGSVCGVKEVSHGPFLIFLLAISTWLASQEAPRPQLEPRPAVPAPAPPGGTDKQIILDVQVSDRSGTPVRGLHKQDFTLLDDKQPLPIVGFQAVDAATPTPADPPLEIVLVIDAVNASFSTVAYGRDAVRKFLLQNDGKPPEPISLVAVTDNGAKVVQESSRDGKVLAAAYDQYATGLRSINRSQGYYGAAERFDISLQALQWLTQYEANRPGRKLMIWLSPGWPLLTGPELELSDKDDKWLFNSIVDNSSGLRQARVTLYSVDPLGLADAATPQIAYYREFLKGVYSPSHAVPANLSLQVLAEQSGGRVLNSSNDLLREAMNCEADAKAFYVLTFDARRADRRDEYHSLELKVDKSGIKVRTRAGYYAQP
jgi:VWFA-related protein